MSGATIDTRALSALPERILSSGRLVFLTDIGYPEIGYPPMQYSEDGVVKGLDIDIGREIGARLGVEARFEDVPLRVIADELHAGAGDVVICGLTDTAERRHRLTFIHYLRIGQALIVPAGNPANLASPNDLSGRRVFVQEDASNGRSLAALNQDLQLRGLAPIKITGVAGTTGEVSRLLVDAVQKGLADASFVDIHNAQWVAAKHDGLAVAPFVLNENPAGLAVRPDEVDLQQALKAAVRAMYIDGSMARILGVWNLERLALARVDEVRISS